MSPSSAVIRKIVWATPLLLSTITRSSATAAAAAATATAAASSRDPSQRRAVFSSTTTGVPCSSFIPCAAPRFDVFAEQLVCSWTAATKEPKVLVAPVEEVMRSCGGAVQGIRERALVTVDDSRSSNNNNEENNNNADGLYLNRANDGFVFFDSGSYSFGPTSIYDDSTDKKESSSSSLSDFQVANLMFGNKKSRLLLTSSSSGSSSAEDPIYLRKTLFGGAEESSSSSSVPATSAVHWYDDGNPCDTLSIKVLSAIQCSMPSAGQPWNLQRAKWSKFVVMEDDDHDDHDDLTGEQANNNDIDDSIACWVSSQQPASMFLSWAGLPNKLGGGYDPDGIVTQMGSLCQTSGFLQIMARMYSAGGGLSNVLYLQGRILRM